MSNWGNVVASVGKWVFAALTALGGAKIFDVVYKHQRDKQTTRIIRKHLYQELTSNFESVIGRLAISSSLEGIKQGTAHRFNDKLDITFQMKNQHESLDKTLFWSIDEIHTIDSLYTKVNLIVMESDPYRARTLSIDAAAAFEKAVADRKLDESLVKNVCTGNVWNYLLEIIEGRQQGASAAVNPFA